MCRTSPVPLVASRGRSKQVIRLKSAVITGMPDKRTCNYTTAQSCLRDGGAFGRKGSVLSFSQQTLHHICIGENIRPKTSRSLIAHRLRQLFQTTSEFS